MSEWGDAIRVMNASEVRDAIAVFADACANLIINAGESNAEIVVGRRSNVTGQNFNTIGQRIDGIDSQFIIIAAQLLSKLSKSDIQNLIGFADINKNLSKIDQTMLTDALLQQIAGTTPVNATPAPGSLTTDRYADGSVIAKKTNFIDIRTENLFNKDTVTVDKIIDSSGTIVNGAGNVLSDFTPVESSTTYTSKYIGNRNYYDASQVKISTELYSVGKTLTTPANTKFIRYSFLNNYGGDPNRSLSEMFVKGSTLPSEYIYYSNPIIDFKNGYTEKMKNMPNGYAGLDSNGVIPTNLLDKCSISVDYIADDTNANFDYVGTWQADTGKTGWYGETRHGSSKTNDSVTFTFTGTGIKLYDATSNNRGKIEIFIDNISQGIIDRYSSTEMLQQLAFEIDSLTYGTHTLKAVIQYEVNPNHTNLLPDQSNLATIPKWFFVDYVHVYNIQEKTFTEVSQTVIESNNGINLKFWFGNQAEYDAIPVKDSNTAYLIEGV
ncbi:phage upper tail fiber protein [Clostridium pasteurianum]|uniref:Minor tail protein gp31 C-terminal domain-containing protein n=1 Tax=Clostridium pasteurianum BC1 TaxID=86416 RepID=R4JYN6_CLOPA|nr:hypothetical protein [Clostridium pasteurianum]AGK95413.1 hypothetical protein Clopa_0351 [Clostridium pasteurianum BC1]